MSSSAIVIRWLERLFDPWKAELVHFNSKLEEIIQALALRLGFGNVITPDITV
jgi:hypothetical protein